MIVRSLSPYKGVIGRLGIQEIQAVPSTAHEMLKFPANGGIVTIRSTILIPADCTIVITSSKELNPKKCTFGEREGMFLGYMISPEGIKLCPDKTEVVLQLPSPQTTKEVQSLNGKLASLNRFLSKSAEKSLPLVKTLKNCIKKSDFYWTPEAKQAIKQLKQHLSDLPLLVAPKPNEELIVYLAASHGAISAVLMTERDTVQTSVYFVSRALQGPELNYSPMEKLVLSLVFAAKRLRRYFQAHPIVVITDQPINKIMSRPDVAGRLQKWSVMLGEHNITYRPRTSVKGHIIADFLVLVEILKEKSIHEEEVATVVEEEGTTWMTPILEYLKDGTLPGDKKEASKLRIKAKHYELLEGILYKRSFLKPWLWCVGPLQADYVIRKIHEVVKSRDEISLRRGYCDNCALSSYQSMERDRLIVIEFMVVMGISFCSHFSDNENDGNVLTYDCDGLRDLDRVMPVGVIGLTVGSHESTTLDVNVSLKTIAGNSVSTDLRS
ncbi:reverse transcriptase domain-containing protein [Tanacetum coccineum]